MPLLNQKLSMTLKVSTYKRRVYFSEVFIDGNFVFKPDQKLLHVIFDRSFEDENHVLNISTEDDFLEIFTIHFILLVS